MQFQFVRTVRIQSVNLAKVVGLRNKASETGSIAFHERRVKGTPARLNITKAHYL
jgi:hypothetical protein